MCHDLLNLEGNKYVHEVSFLIANFINASKSSAVSFGYCTPVDCIVQVPGKTSGPPEKKEVLLEDHDPVWLELRHAHIADVISHVYSFFFLQMYL